MSDVTNTARSETVHIPCSKTSAYTVCSNNSTIIRYNNIQTRGNPPKSFGLVWPSSGLVFKEEKYSNVYLCRRGWPKHAGLPEVCMLLYLITVQLLEYI